MDIRETDWLNPKNYPPPATRDLTLWAWEFLRRNPSYRADYERMQAIPAEHWTSRPRNYPGGCMDNYESIPPARPGETCGDYVTRVGKYQCLTPLKRFRHTWGLKTPKDPDESYDEGIKVSFTTSSPTYMAHHPDTAGWAPYRKCSTMMPGEIYVKFQLGLPIDPQVEHAKEKLKNEQVLFAEQYGIRVKRPKVRDAYFHYMLRVLDAKTNLPYGHRISNEAIAQQFADEHAQNDRFWSNLDAKKISEWHKRGKALRDGGYLLIALRYFPS